MVGAGAKRVADWLRTRNSAALCTTVAIAMWAAWYTRAYADIAQFEIACGVDEDQWMGAVFEQFRGEFVSLPPLHSKLILWLGGPDQLMLASHTLNAFAFAIGIIGCGLIAALLQRRPEAVAFTMPITALFMACAVQTRGYLWLFHPDMTTFAVVTSVGVATLVVARVTNIWTVMALGLACGIACCVREHGMIIGITATLFVGWCTAGGARTRIRNMAIVLALIEATSRILVGQWLALSPFFAQAEAGLFYKTKLPWADTLALLGLRPTHVPSWMIANVHTNETPQLVSAIAGHTWIAVKPYGLVILGGLISAGLLLKAKRRRELLAIAVPLSPFPALFFLWAEPRHVLSMAGVLTGVTTGCLLAYVLPYTQRLHKFGNYGLAAFALLAAMLIKPRVLALDTFYFRDFCRNAITYLDRPVVDAARWIRANAEPGEDVLLGPHISLNIEASLAESPGLRVTLVGERPDVSWRTWVLTKENLLAVWELQHEVPPWKVYKRKRPEGIEEPCLRGTIEGWGRLEDGPQITVHEGCAPGELRSPAKEPGM